MVLRISRIDIRLVFVLALCGFFQLATGCGGDTLTPVSGKVTVGNNPVTAGTVIYKPNVAKGNNSKSEPQGEIDATGQYTLKTNGQAGAPPGWYKVVVPAAAPPDSDPAKMTRPQKWLVPLKYVTEATSDLEKEVVARPEPGAYDLKLLP